MADIEKEGLALLLAIIADVDPGLDLLVDDPAERGLAEPVELGRVDRAAAGALDIEPGERRRARQAAGVGRQDPLGAPLHGALPAGPNKKPVCRCNAIRANSISVPMIPQMPDAG